MEDTHWPLLHCLDQDGSTTLGLIILNQPLKPQLHMFKPLWSKACVKVAVDGGTNELYQNTAGEHEAYIPDFITGDFDSVQDDVFQFYKDKGSRLIETEDQNLNDFDKCLRVLERELRIKQPDLYFVLGAFGGRLDQVFRNINTLFDAGNVLPGVPVYLFADNSFACLLQKGRHVLHVDSGFEDDWCGLIPVGGSCDCVTTTGLKWNLDKQRLKFGELISTSNTWGSERSSVVTIETDQPLLWTMGVKCN